MRGRIDTLIPGKFPVVTIRLETSPEVLERYLNKEVEVSIKPYRKKRSRDANALLWACIGEVAAAIGSDNWSVYLYMLERYGVFTHIMVKPEAVKAVRRQWRETSIVGEVEHEGQKYIEMLCFYGSSTYNTKEFSRLIDGVISDMRDMGLETPHDAEVNAALEAYDKSERRKEEREVFPE